MFTILLTPALTPVLPVTSLGYFFTSDVITFDQNWYHLYSASERGKDLYNDAQIRVIQFISSNMRCFVMFITAVCMIREFKITTSATATGTSPNKRFNEQGRVVRKPVNVNPRLNVNWSIMFSCLKTFFASNVWCSWRLLHLKTEGQTI